MTYRQWYAQLDVFDTIRRLLAILKHWNLSDLTRDRLFISDFYFVNPSLLHHTHMTADARRAFSQLKIKKPDQEFINFPSPPILYTKMAGIQEQAFHNLTGRGLLVIEDLQGDRCMLSAAGTKLVEQIGDRLILPNEWGMLQFLVHDFALLGQGKGGLRAVTGLRRLGVQL